MQWNGNQHHIRSVDPQSLQCYCLALQYWVSVCDISDFVVHQTRPPGRRRTPLPPWSPASRCLALRCGEAGFKLPHLSYDTCIQDGPNVHVWSISGEKALMSKTFCIASSLSHVWFGCILSSVSLNAYFFLTVSEQQRRLQSLHTWWRGQRLWQNPAVKILPDCEFKRSVYHRQRNLIGQLDLLECGQMSMTAHLAVLN